MNFKEQREKKAYVALEDGSIFYGYSVGAPADACGEIVFNNSMIGYQEILSDKSYAGKIAVMTVPEIGCYGANKECMTDGKFFAAGLVARCVSEPSNWQSEESFKSALSSGNVPAIAGVDTRALTCLLREKGSQRAFICASGAVKPSEAIEKAKAHCPA